MSDGLETDCGMILKFFKLLRADRKLMLVCAVVSRYRIPHF